MSGALRRGCLLIAQAIPTAGLRAGDTVVAINGKAIADTAALVSETAALSPGTRIEFKVLRGRRPTWSTMSFRVCRCASGYCRCRFRCACCWPRNPSW